MDITIAEALRRLGPDAPFRVANQARPPASYVLAAFLPERNALSYDVSAGGLTIRATMAGMVGMDSPYPEGGVIEASTFMERSAKIAHALDLPEEALRELQALVAHLRLAGGNALREMTDTVLNFVDKLLVQPHLDTMEYLRGQALANGVIDWTFNRKQLLVNYGVPAANILPRRTGTAGYGGTASVFWSDVATIQRRLNYNVRAYVAHIDTLNAILANPANNIEVLAQAAGGFRVRRLVTRGTGAGATLVPSSDAREAIDLIGYALEGELLDPANPGQTVKVPFFPREKLVGIGDNAATTFVVGSGGNAPEANAIGYTHIGPSVEANGAAGRWARVFTPEHRPWALRGESVQNALPVVTAPDKIVIASSELPAAA